MPGISVTQGASQADIGRIISRFTRRQIARRLFEAGRQSATIAERQAGLFIQARDGDRRRTVGAPHVHGNFKATYTDLTEFSAGAMEFTLTNPAPALVYLEYGTGPHQIPPHGTYLAWPGHVQKGPVEHPGSTRFKGRTRRAINLAMREQFPGIKPINIQ
jgi:hypothetical protein